MKMDSQVRARAIRNAFVSVGLYALPIALMFLALAVTGEHPWAQMQAAHLAAQNAVHSTGPWAWLSLDRYGLVVFTLLLGIVEFVLGLYDEHWTKNERLLDITCFLLPKIIVGPASLTSALNCCRC